MKTSAKTPDPEKLLQRMAALCARSEQCEYDISTKLWRAGLPREDIDAIIGELRAGRFLDNSRFARAFARDKVRFAGWGRLKIREALMLKRISSDIVTEAIGAIEAADYKAALSRATLAKARSLSLDDPASRNKMLRYLTSRGFEAALAVNAWEALQRRRKP